MRNVGTIVRGIRTPIIKEGMDLASIVVDSIMVASKSESFTLRNKDIIGITEAVVAISDGNYASVDDVAKDISEKFPSGHVGVVFPILSRNRFSLILKGIARGCKKITMLLSYPADEVGNHLFLEELLDQYHINPYTDILTEEVYNQYFKDIVHPFTGINYVTFYRELVEKENCQIEFVFSNHPKEIINYTKEILTCDIHTRYRTKQILKENNVTVYGLDEVLNKPIGDSGYNPMYGLLGSNKSTEERLKLFPKNGQELVEKIQKIILEKTGIRVEVLVYGDGAFKDPVGKIWELADPMVSPAYTKGLEGTPNEIKLKYISDNQFSSLSGAELKASICKAVQEKETNLKGKMITEGTTPRRYVDLIGSLCDLTSGSGDKGTPVVLIQGYFDNIATE